MRWLEVEVGVLLSSWHWFSSSILATSLAHVPSLPAIFLRARKSFSKQRRLPDRRIRSSQIGAGGMAALLLKADMQANGRNVG